MRIIRLSAENIKKIKAIEITPQGDTIVISGKNEQGKTSILDSIWWALGGKDNISPEPIRKGEKKAKIKLDLGEYKITRTFTQAGTYLVVENAEGATFKSPQALLDKMIGDLSFDPLAFVHEKNKEEILLNLVGLTELFETLKAKRDGVYAERTLVNRELKNIESQLAGMEKVEGPAEEVSITELTGKLQEANQQIEKNNEVRRELENRRQNAETEKSSILKMAEEIESLEEQLEEKRKAYEVAGKNHEKQTSIVISFQDKVVALKDPDTVKIQEAISVAEETNYQARAQKERSVKEEELKGKQTTADTLTSSIDKIDQEREGAITKAKFPIEGLSFEEGKIVYRGIPFEQASSAEQLKVSMAIAMALNPELRVIRITDGSLIDSDNMEIISKMAKDKDYQVWVEKVDETGKVGIYIEEGEIKAVNE